MNFLFQKNRHKFPHFLIFLTIIFFLNSCIKFDPQKAKNLPTNSQERARKNVEEGRGVSAGSLLRGGGRGTNYEFSTSNPMWRASLEVIDFIPLVTVDYSGGLIITDWYSDNVNDNTQLKITLRFLSNEINATNIKIIIHKKICERINSQNCKIQIDPSLKIKEELTKSIMRLATKLEQEQKNKKK